MRVLIFISCLLFAFSCKTVEHTVIESNVRDSVVYVDQTIVDTFKVPSETLEVFVPYEVFKYDTVIHFKSGRANTQVRSLNGMLKINTRCDSLEKILLSRNKYISQFHTAKHATKTKSNIQPVRWYHKWAIVGFVSLALLFIGLLIIKLI